MKTWKTVALSVITTASLVTIGATTYNYLQPSHYEGDTFTNVSTTTSNTSTSTSTSVSSSTESVEDTNSSDLLEQRGGTCMGVTEDTTFKVELVSPTNGWYTVEHIPTGDKINAIRYEEAMNFCSYMEQIAHGKTTLSYSMQENYNTWKGN